MTKPVKRFLSMLIGMVVWAVFDGITGNTSSKETLLLVGFFTAWASDE